MNEKIKTAVLAGLLLLTLCVMLCACSEDTSGNAAEQLNSADTITESAESPEKAVGSEETAIEPAFSDVTFGGENFTFLSREDSAGAWTILDAFTEGMTGEVLNDAVYERNEDVMEKYDVVIAQVLSRDVTSETKTAVLSGACDYDAVLTNAEMNLSLVFGDALYDMNALEHIDFTASWWDGALNKNFDFFGHQFYAISDMNIMAFDATWITMANTTVLDSHGFKLDSLYDEVRAGTWTIDRYKELSDLNCVDVNNNSHTDSEDKYGTVMQGHGADGFLMGCGLQYVARQDDGSIALVPLSDRTISIFEKVTSVVNNKTAFNSHDSTQNDKHSSDTEYGQVIFAENRAMFFTETLQCVRRLREMETSFGVLPMPKYDEQQKNYISMVHWWASSMLSVPLNAPNPEKTGVILEYMSYLSTEKVRDVYYDIVITDKFFRDAASTEMLEYVMQERVMDLAYVMFGDSISGEIRAKMYSGATTYASTYKVQEKVIANTIKNQFADYMGE